MPQCTHISIRCRLFLTFRAREFDAASQASYLALISHIDYFGASMAMILQIGRWLFARASRFRQGYLRPGHCGFRAFAMRADGRRRAEFRAHIFGRHRGFRMREAQELRDFHICPAEHGSSAMRRCAASPATLIAFTGYFSSMMGS